MKENDALNLIRQAATAVLELKTVNPKSLRISFVVGDNGDLVFRMDCEFYGTGMNRYECSMRPDLIYDGLIDLESVLNDAMVHFNAGKRFSETP